MRLPARSVLANALCAGLLAAAAPAFAAETATGPGDYLVGFGPFIGGGTISTGARVRHTSGYSLSLERRWSLGGGVAIGPRFEVSNAFVNTRDTGNGDAKLVGTYDNRVIAGGATLALDVGNQGTFAQALYLTALAGRGYSKLALDESTERTFKQSLYGNMSGNWLGGELGAWIPLKGAFGVNLAVLGNSYRVAQKDACGTFDGDQVGEDGSLSLTQGAYECGNPALDATATLRTVAGKVGLSLGF